MDDFTRRARRYTAGRTVLDLLAVVFLLCSIAFWGVLHWQVLVANGGGIPQIIVAIVMTLIYSLALPLLLSALVPSTPAGQLLQKTQWRTIGFWVIIPSVAFLLWYAHDLMLAWFASQPTIADAGLERRYTISALIAFVVIVALAWTQVSPERWIREVEQAHNVRKLELEQRGELAIVKARLLWAEQKALIGYAKLLPAEQQEVIDTMKGLLMGIGDTQRSIARTMGIQGELERSIMGDTEIADTLDYVARQLGKPAASIDTAVTWMDDRGRESAVIKTESAARAHVDSRPGPSESRAAPSSPGRPRMPQDDGASDKEYMIAIDCIHKPVWVAQDVADLLRIDKTTAQKKVRVWIARNLVEQTRLGHYRWLTEEEA